MVETKQSISVRIAALLMAVVLTLGLAPSLAFADDAGEDDASANPTQMDPSNSASDEDGADATALGSDADDNKPGGAIDLAKNAKLSYDKQTLTYNGQEQTLKNVQIALLDGTVLKEGRDYTLSYKNNVEAAAYNDPNPPTVTATAVDGSGYTGSISDTFTIEDGSSPVEPEKVAVPQAVSDLVEDGSSLLCVPGGADYTLENPSGTADIDDNGNCVAEAAGDYTVVATLDDPSDSTWDDGSTKDVTIKFTIQASTQPVIDVEIPVAETGLKADGDPQIGVQHNSSNYELSTTSPGAEVDPDTGDVVATEAGTYQATATLLDTEATEWKDGTTEDKTVTFTIAAAEVTKVAIPVAESGLVYNGSSQVCVKAGEDYELSAESTGTSVDADGDIVATEAGSYQATASLLDVTSTAWSDGTTEDKTVSFAIAAAEKTKVNAPAGQTLTYNGQSQIGVAAGTGYTLSGPSTNASIDGSGNAVATDAGSYSVTAALANKDNSVWADTNDTADKTVNFSVQDAAKKTVDVPQAKTGLVYNGNSQVGVSAATGYTLSNASLDGSGNAVGTNAGNYSATATLQDGYTWTDGSTDAKTVNFSIAKADYDMSGVSYKDASYAYDGRERALLISGNLPKGVNVSYQNNSRKDVGSTKATASFSVDDPNNYNTPASMTATLTITQGNGSSTTAKTYDNLPLGPIVGVVLAIVAALIVVMVVARSRSKKAAALEENSESLGKHSK